MAGFKKIVFAPLTVLSFLAAHWRQKLFRMGRWKSVEFELPTVAVLHNLSGKELLENMSLVQGFLPGHCPVFLPRLSVLNSSVTLQPIEGGHYLSKPPVPGAILAYRDSMVLALSESVALFPDQKAFLIPTAKLDFDVRQDVSLLLCCSGRPYWEESYWPVGRRRESLGRLGEIGVCVIVDDQGLGHEILDREAREYCGANTLVVVCKSEGEYGVSGLHYSQDGSEFASDRDTFEALFINSLFRKK